MATVEGGNTCTNIIIIRTLAIMALFTTQISVLLDEVIPMIITVAKKLFLACGEAIAKLILLKRKLIE